MFGGIEVSQRGYRSSSPRETVWLWVKVERKVNETASSFRLITPHGDRPHQRGNVNHSSDGNVHRLAGDRSEDNELMSYERTMYNSSR